MALENKKEIQDVIKAMILFPKDKKEEELSLSSNKSTWLYVLKSYS